MMTGVSFRQAALEGNVATMRSLLADVEIEEAGSETKMTAAHWAAVKGHASVLRFLHSLGDSFSKANVKRRLPEQMAKDPECKRVFELVRLAKKTLAVVDQVFPERVDVSKPDEEPPEFHLLRETSITLATEEIGERITPLLVSVANEYMQSGVRKKGKYEEIAKQWSERHCKPLSYLSQSFYDLLAAKHARAKGGACGETSGIAFGYLAYVLKTDYRIERLKVENKTINHGFIVVNRDPNSEENFGLDHALIIDAYTRQSFFYENFGDVKSIIDREAIEAKTVLCSMPLPPVPVAPWSQERSIAVMKETYDLIVIEGKTRLTFAEWNITE